MKKLLVFVISFCSIFFIYSCYEIYQLQQVQQEKTKIYAEITQFVLKHDTMLKRGAVTIDGDTVLVLAAMNSYYERYIDDLYFFITVLIIFATIILTCCYLYFNLKNVLK